MKNEIEALLMESPSVFKPETSEGYLMVKIKMGEKVPEEVEGTPEAIEAIKNADPDRLSAYMMIECDIQVGELSSDDIINCGPEDYLENGVVAGILDAIRHGLADGRGINFKYAVQDAQEKAMSALQCLQGEDMLDKLGKVALAAAETGGEA